MNFPYRSAASAPLTGAPGARSLGLAAVLLLFSAAQALAAVPAVPSAALPGTVPATLAAPATDGSAPLEGGSADASLRGKVYDLRGVPLIGAFVAVVAQGADRVTAITVTDSSGQFRVAQLPPGPYTLVAQNLGFVSAVVQEIDVPNVEPVAVQLRPRPGVPLLDTAAELDLGWAFRSGVRDVLRQEEGSKLADGGGLGDVSLESRQPVGLDKSFFGELQFWNLPSFGDGAAVTGGTTLAVGSFETPRDGWRVQAHMDDNGAMVARTDVRQGMGTSHDLAFGITYAGSHVRWASEGDQNLHRGWVGSAYAEDTWRVGQPFVLSYGLRYEHYDFLDEGLLLSPRVELAFLPDGATRVSGGVSYAAQAPGLRDLSFEFDPLDARYVDIIPSGDLESERVMRYELGLQRRLGETEFRVLVYYDQVTDELLGFYVQSPGGENDYLLFNVGDADVQGFELGMSQEIGEWLVGKLDYGYGMREGDEVPVDELVGAGLVSAVELTDEETELDATHDLRAALEAILGRFDTRLLAVYHWQKGVPVLRDERLVRQYGRLDVRVRQPLPFRALDTEWAALVQVRNLLGHEYEGILDLALTDLPFLSRLVSGGLAVRF